MPISENLLVGIERLYSIYHQNFLEEHGLLPEEQEEEFHFPRFTRKSVKKRFENFIWRKDYRIRHQLEKALKQYEDCQIRLTGWRLDTTSTGSDDVDYLIEYSSDDRNFKHSNLIRIENGKPQILLCLIYPHRKGGQFNHPNMDNIVNGLRKAYSEISDERERQEIEINDGKRIVVVDIIPPNFNLGEQFEDIFRKYNALDELRSEGHKPFGWHIVGDQLTMVDKNKYKMALP